MAKRKKISPEELKEKSQQYDIKEQLRAVELGITPNNPTRTFEVGERVILGAHQEVYVHDRYCIWCTGHMRE